ncbi:uncharacterized protein LOC106028352 [Cavia porcellus]|uniref:uncharacterized protein LOC106028352 n=1 Tax=Cavia porcellus TaxID=10141 RepID=UPI000661CF27
MSGLELTGRLPCPGSGRAPYLLCPALLFPRCWERWEKGEVRSEEHPNRGSGRGSARGGVYGAAGPSAAFATATAAAILGSYCTGSRFSHVTAPARSSLLYAAAARTSARAPPASRTHAWPRPLPSGLGPFSGACAGERASQSLRLRPCVHAHGENLPAEAELLGKDSKADLIRTACEVNSWVSSQQETVRVGHAIQNVIEKGRS